MSGQHDLISERFTKIKKLSLKGSVSYQGVVKICTSAGLRGIQELSLRHRGALQRTQHPVEDFSLHLIGFHCKKIERLSLANLDGISSQAIRDLVLQCSKLNALGLSEGLQIASLGDINKNIAATYKPKIVNTS